MNRAAALGAAAAAAIGAYAVSQQSGGPDESTGSGSTSGGSTPDPVADPDEELPDLGPATDPEDVFAQPNDPDERHAMIEPPQLIEGAITYERLRANPDLLVGYPDWLLEMVEEKIESTDWLLTNVGEDLEPSTARNAIGSVEVDGAFEKVSESAGWNPAVYRGPDGEEFDGPEYLQPDGEHTDILEFDSSGRAVFS